MRHCQILRHQFFKRQWATTRSMLRQGLDWPLMQRPSDVSASSLWTLLVTLSLSQWPEGKKTKKAEDESRQVSALLPLPITCFLQLYQVKRGILKECENLMVWGSTAEGRELVWACACVPLCVCMRVLAFHRGTVWDSAAVLSHMSLHCRIQPWCHLSLSSVSLWISQAVEGGVYFSHDVKREDLIR